MASSGAGALRHMAVLKLVNREDKQKAVDSLQSMASGLPGVTWLSFKVVSDLGLSDMTADLAVIADFPDKENYVAYAKHPQHLSLINANKELVANRLSIQIELPAKL